MIVMKKKETFKDKGTLGFDLHSRELCNRKQSELPPTLHTKILITYMNIHVTVLGLI